MGLVGQLLGGEAPPPGDFCILWIRCLFQGTSLHCVFPIWLAQDPASSPCLSFPSRQLRLRAGSSPASIFWHVLSFIQHSEGERTRKLGDMKIPTLKHGKSGVFYFSLKAPQQILPTHEAYPSVYRLCHSTHKPVPLDIFFSCTQVPSHSSWRLNTLAFHISKRRHLC